MYNRLLQTLVNGSANLPNSCWTRHTLPEENAPDGVHSQLDPEVGTGGIGQLPGRLQLPRNPHEGASSQGVW